jgi:hypothetical protein
VAAGVRSTENGPPEALDRLDDRGRRATMVETASASRILRATATPTSDTAAAIMNATW